MDDPIGPLFETPGRDEPPVDPTLGVMELNRAIESALKGAFPGEVWVKGEIQGLSRTRMRKHWYFELVEKEAGRDQVAARVSVNLLNWNRGRVQRDMAAAPGFELDDDVEVRIRVKVGYFPPWGKLQLEMVGVDPAFTLGQMAANRERILRALAVDGLLERNARLPVPALPLRIGLVTSVGSAAYNDFVQEIQRSGLGFHLQAIDARVQGEAAERSLLQALHHFRRHRVDVVCVVRGGGSRSDLAGFDGEALARAIARMPMPVFTGIGHEIDTSVADHVAHSHFKTPTACAAALVERARAFAEALGALEEGVLRAAHERLDDEAARLVHQARHAARAATGRLRAEEGANHDRARRLRREAPRAVASAMRRLGATGERVAHRTQLQLGRQEGRVQRAADQLAPGRLRRILSAHEAGLGRHARRVLQLAPRLVARREERHVGLARQLALLDPRRTLRRGYALAYGPDGRLLKGIAAVEPGQALRTVLADGELHSTVERTEATPPEEA